ncbi:hypothetical protein [Pseudoalteromonas sp. SG44-8]|uniref:hypothetical protein n=1 Tax=Pseudoalteromonas sp. SG44-8 TaxID=2760958 RepID=UPI001600531C|nr:hypothetical protein [Pseudoalteromonas sp. SG44-8]MBB1399778.1 hypothetical protein [Pseudoalteromonas sp. SG44-8]
MNKPPDFKGWAVFALGLFFILFGLPMVIGGSWLVILGGSGSQNITSFLSQEKVYAFRAMLGLA